MIRWLVRWHLTFTSGPVTIMVKAITYWSLDCTFNNILPMIWWFQANWALDSRAQFALNRYNIDRRTNIIIHDKWWQIIHDIHLIVLLLCVEDDQGTVTAVLPTKFQTFHQIFQIFHQICNQFKYFTTCQKPPRLSSRSPAGITMSL